MAMTVATRGATKGRKTVAIKGVIKAEIRVEIRAGTKAQIKAATQAETRPATQAAVVLAGAAAGVLAATRAAAAAAAATAKALLVASQGSPVPVSQVQILVDILVGMLGAILAETLAAITVVTKVATKVLTKVLAKVGTKPVILAMTPVGTFRRASQRPGRAVPLAVAWAGTVMRLEMRLEMPVLGHNRAPSVTVLAVQRAVSWAAVAKPRLPARARWVVSTDRQVLAAQVVRHWAANQATHPGRLGLRWASAQPSRQRQASHAG